MAQREHPGPFCSAPDRAAGRSLTADFFCPRIRRTVTPTYAAHCDEYQELAPDP